MINIQRQYYTRVKWSLVKASLWDRFKFKVTFGLFGRMEWIDRDEKDIVLYIAPDDERTCGVIVNHMFQNKFNGDNPPKPINCRCSIAEVDNG